MKFLSHSSNQSISCKIFSRLFLAETSYRFGDFEQTFLAFDRVKALQPEGPAAQQVGSEILKKSGGTDPKNDGISVSVMVLYDKPPTRSFICLFNSYGCSDICISEFCCDVHKVSVDVHKINAFPQEFAAAIAVWIQVEVDQALLARNLRCVLAQRCLGSRQQKPGKVASLT